MNKAELIRKIKNTIADFDNSIKNLPKDFPKQAKKAVEKDKQAKGWFEVFFRMGRTA